MHSVEKVKMVNKVLYCALHHRCATWSLIFLLTLVVFNLCVPDGVCDEFDQQVSNWTHSWKPGL